MSDFDINREGLHDTQQQLDELYEQWCAEQEQRGELAGTPDEMECYACAGFNGRDFVMRKVVKLGPVVEQRRDATQTYVLECGHTVI